MGQGMDSPEVFDFLEEYFQDLEGEGARPLEHYLARYPGHEEAIRREYHAQQGGLRTAEEPREAATEEGRVGPYRLLSEIGRGGQGVVYRAEDTRIARRVALKVLPRAALLLSEDSRSRFKREAEVISRLDAPGLCGIYDAVVEEDLAYMAMPFVEGQTLSAAVTDAREGRPASCGLVLGPRSDEDLMPLLEFFEKAARALHSAHEAGVIHRDIKPGNLMVTEEVQPVWLDFGLARETGADAVALTLSGEIFGTPAYMSPEQVGGEPLDRRADVWSLGVTMFEALCLERPFEASTAHGLLAEIRYEAPRRALDINPTLGEELGVVLETALERDVARRYKSALDFAEDLARLRRREPITARPASRSLRLRRWVQRYPVLFALILVVTASLVAVSWLLREQLRAVEDKDAALVEADLKLEAALGRHKAQRAGALLDEDPGSALVLAIEGVELAPNVLTRKALFAALEACWLRAVYEAGEGRRFVDLTFVPGEERVLAACTDGTVLLHDLESGDVLAEWSLVEPGASGEPPLSCIAAAPDGLSFAVGATDGRLLVRGFGQEEEALVLGDPGEPILSLAFAAGGERLAARTNSSLLVHDMTDTGTPVRLTGLEVPLAALVHDPELDAFVERPLSCSGAVGWRASDGTPLTPAELAPAPDVEGEPVALRVHRGGGCFIAATSSDGGVIQQVFDLEREDARELTGSSRHSPVAAAFSPDGLRLAVIDGDRALRIWDTRDGRLLGEGRGYLNAHFLEWSADGAWVLTRQRIGPQARLWYGRSRPDTFEMRAGSAPVLEVVAAPGGRRAASLDRAGAVAVWCTDPASVDLGERELWLDGAGPGFSHIALDPSGTLLLAAGDGLLEVWDLESGDRLVRREGGSELAGTRWTDSGELFLVSGPERLDPRSGAVSRLGAAAEGSRVVPLPDGRSWLELDRSQPAIALRGLAAPGARWQVELSGERGRPRGAAADLVAALAFAPDGSEVALARSDRWIDFLDLATGEATRQPLGVFPPAGIDWSADGRRLLVWGRSGRGAFRVQDLQPVEPGAGAMRAEQYHAADLTDAGFGDGGRLAFSASRDGGLLIRRVDGLDDPRAMRLVARLVGPGPAVTCGVLGDGPLGPRVLAGLADGTVRVWPVDPMPPALERRPRRALTEWELARERRQAEAARLEYR